MRKAEPAVLKFNFQEIELSQIPELLPVIYRSKYAALREQIVQRVNSMPSNKSFIFALDPSVPVRISDDFIGRICHGVNVAFAKDRMNWRVLWSKAAKAFVVAPFKRRGGIMRKAIPPPPQTETPQGGFKEDPQARLERLAYLMKKCFNITTRQLQEKRGGEQLTDYKRAMLYIGRNGLGLKLSEIAALININSSSATILCQQALTKAESKEKVDILTEALNRG